MQNQMGLVTPPTTPEKKSILDHSQALKGHARKLCLSQDSIYSKVKALFQRGALVPCLRSLVGRDAEANLLNCFIENSIRDRACNSIYISGPPGTGKTAQVNLSLDFLSKNPQDKQIHIVHGQRVRILRINCMLLSKPENIFHEIFSALADPSTLRKKTFDDLYKLILTNSSVDSLVVMLDEMDDLITRDQQVLFQLFHCASLSKSSVLSTKLVVIGISNALDLTDKFLPRLRSNGLNPESLQFLPYSADQIKQVILLKLATLDESDKENTASALLVPLMHPGAVQMCSKKCAAVTGDLRKAFDICYKSIEYVEQQASQRDDFDSLTLQTAPKVLISHVAKVCTSIFGELSKEKISNLNLLQKALLCCLFHLERNLASTGIKVNELYEYYCKHSMRVVENLLGKIKKSEFLEIISALESMSAVTLSDRKSVYTEIGNKMIRSNVLYQDVLKICDDNSILRRILFL